MSRPRVVAALLVALFTLGAALLRASGIDYLLPEVMNRDGLVVVRQVEMYRGRAQAEPGAWWYTSYPHLMARIAALLPPEPAPPERPASLEEHLEIARAPWVRLRWISIVLSLLAIPGTYLLARRFLDRAGALFAAGAIATSLHHVCLSIQEKPHAAATSFVLLALLAALWLRRRPGALSFGLCGLAAALAIGMLHNAAVALAPIAAAFFLREKKGRRSWPWVLLSLAMVAIAVIAFYPFFFEGFFEGAGAGPRGEGDSEAARFGTRLIDALQGAPLARILSALWALDPLLVTFGAAGIVAWGTVWGMRALRRRDRLNRDLLVVIAFALPYLAVLVLFRNTLVRFFLPLLPLLACSAGWLYSRATVAATARLRVALGVALLAVPLVVAWHFARIRCRPGPLDLAARWVAENADPRETVVVLPYYDLPLFPTPETLAENARHRYRTIWSEYLARVPAAGIDGVRRPILVEPGQRPQSRVDLVLDPLAYLARHSARIVVLDLAGGGEDLLAGVAKREARITPWRDERRRERGIALFGTGFDPLAPSFASILRARSLGTTVEIYRLP